MIDRSGAGRGHILIGGPGRSGTTLLVQYFSALGFDTGFSLPQALRRVDDLSNAGLEHSLERGNLPYVAKSPYFGAKLGRRLDRGDLSVSACVMPVRDLFAAAESRRRVSSTAEAATGDPRHPGGLTFGAVDKPRRQEQRIAVQQYKLVHTLARHQIPLYLVPFPEFATGERDVFDSLRVLLEPHGVTAEESGAALQRVVDPSRIHDFGQPVDQDADDE